MTVEFACPYCKERFGETFTVDDALELRRDGITSDEDFRRRVEQADKRSIN